MYSTFFLFQFYLRPPLLRPPPPDERAAPPPDERLGADLCIDEPDDLLLEELPVLKFLLLLVAGLELVPDDLFVEDPWLLTAAPLLLVVVPPLLVLVAPPLLVLPVVFLVGELVTILPVFGL